MARYIDVDALIERLGINQDCTECSYCTRKCYCSWNPDPGEICIVIAEQPTVTINDTSEENKVTNCNDNISRQAICDALDIVFADRIKSAGFDSYETADRDTQLVCDGIMRAIDVVLGQPTVDHLAEVSKKGDLISREDAVDAISKIKRTDNWQAAVSMALMDLPSAQPTLTNAESNTELSVDLISRADALSCFHDWIDQRGDVHTADEMPEYQRIEQLPSAQPEIITCMDCIHYTPLGKDKAWGRCSVHSSPTENQRMCQSCDFCAWAERRTDDCI